MGVVDPRADGQTNEGSRPIGVIAQGVGESYIKMPGCECRGSENPF